MYKIGYTNVGKMETHRSKAYKLYLQSLIILSC